MWTKQIVVRHETNKKKIPKKLPCNGSRVSSPESPATLQRVRCCQFGVGFGVCAAERQPEASLLSPDLLPCLVPAKRGWDTPLGELYVALGHSR